MVRFMALNNLQNMRQAKAWYYLSFTLFYGMATGVGMVSRIYLSDAGSFDAELALPMMAQQLLPSVLVGLTDSPGVRNPPARRTIDSVPSDPADFRAKDSMRARKAI